MLTLFAHAVITVAQLPLRYIGLDASSQESDVNNRTLVGHHGVQHNGVVLWDE